LVVGSSKASPGRPPPPVVRRLGRPENPAAGPDDAIHAASLLPAALVCLAVPPRHPEPERFCRCSNKMKSRYHRTYIGGERRGDGYHGQRVSSTWREDRGPPSPAGCCWLGSAVAASAWSWLTPSSGRRRRRRPVRGRIEPGSRREKGGGGWVSGWRRRAVNLVRSENGVI
jgi:hypothetical protein